MHFAIANCETEWYKIHDVTECYLCLIKWSILIIKNNQFFDGLFSILTDFTNSNWFLWECFKLNGQTINKSLNPPKISIKKDTLKTKNSQPENMTPQFLRKAILILWNFLFWYQMIFFIALIKPTNWVISFVSICKVGMILGLCIRLSVEQLGRTECLPQWIKNL